MLYKGNVLLIVLVLSEYNYEKFNNYYFFLLQFDNSVFTGNERRSEVSNNMKIPLSNYRFVGHTRTVAILAVCSSVLYIEHYVNFILYPCV